MTGYDLTAWPLFRSVLDDPRKTDGRTRRALFLSPLDDPNPDIRRHAETVWKYVVRPALIDTDLSPHRFEGGEMARGLPQPVIDALLDDDLVIACLSFRDPSVFYGLALAQASARPLIVLAEEGQDIGFEPRGAKVVTYSLDPDSMFSGVNVKKLQSAIAGFGEDTIFEQPFRAGASALNGGGNGGASVYERSRQFSWERRLSMVREAKTRIDIMGIANLAFTLHPDSVEVIRARSGSGVEVRMLQCSPVNPSLVSLVGQRDQQHLNAVKNEIEAAAEAWRRICDLPGLDLAITVRRAQTTAPLASALITDQAAVATPYLSSRITGESPTLHALAGSAFHGAIVKEFDQVWSEAATLFRAEPRNSARHQPPANGNTLRPGEPNRHFTNEPVSQLPQGGLMRSFSNLRNGG